jgi:hypothetical protein
MKKFLAAFLASLFLVIPAANADPTPPYNTPCPETVVSAWMPSTPTTHSLRYDFYNEATREGCDTPAPVTWTVVTKNKSVSFVATENTHNLWKHSWPRNSGTHKVKLYLDGVKYYTYRVSTN